ncbi:YraN family protein [Acinetobacter rudis]|uniref:YraN family protein n=1 Tax=Acinetobacter rudis TaxID=632955 RepID=UPI0028106221|nr:YraN family protein [Acinetobacter rudis]MDQ8951915.1 YraN family protein [Acinetobacter rudis]
MRLGQWAELEAMQHLKIAGYELVANNYHSRYGEIDIIALKHRQLVFVEVRARAVSQYANAVESITLVKQVKIIKTALLYLQDQPRLLEYDLRFDVICFDFYRKIAKNVQYDFSKLSYDWQWIENAFHVDINLINL